jgi:hypothetical protein
LDSPAIDGKLIYFFHVPKTGGRTIAKHLEERFGATRVFHPLKSRSWLADFMGNKVGARTAAPGQHVIGHFAPLSLIKGCEQDYFKVCFWRHPADWLLSYYNYRHYRQADRMQRGFSFADFERSLLRNPMTEALLLYSGAVPGPTYFFMSDRAKFDAAVALIERFDQFADIAGVDAFIKAVGYTEKGKPQDRNRLETAKKKLAALSEPARRRIVSTNPVDYYLHRIALGENRALVCAQARRALPATFDARDIGRLAALPYYRFKIWVWPFLPSLRGLLGRKP